MYETYKMYDTYDMYERNEKMKQAFILGIFLTLLTFAASTFGADMTLPEKQSADIIDPVIIIDDKADEDGIAAVAVVATVDRSYSYDSSTPVKVLCDDEIVTMMLGDLLTSVVAAEMPASFEPEALKAQAIAARTNIVRKMLNGSKHENADVCTDSTCCLACGEATEAAAEAVKATDGLIITYDDQPIDAVFFSTSWGETEDAVAVWGSSVPYLVSVKSTGDELSPRYEDIVEVPLTEFCLTVMDSAPEASFSGTWVSESVRTPAGGVESITLGGVEFTGRQVRSLFGLRSTNFTVEVTPTCIRFSTTGYGHNVGMSQYGANAMAQTGSSCIDILTWYYSGTEVTTVNN